MLRCGASRRSAPRRGAARRSAQATRHLLGHEVRVLRRDALLDAADCLVGRRQRVLDAVALLLELVALGGRLVKLVVQRLQLLLEARALLRVARGRLERLLRRGARRRRSGQARRDRRVELREPRHVGLDGLGAGPRDGRCEEPHALELRREDGVEARELGGLGRRDYVRLLELLLRALDLLQHLVELARLRDARAGGLRSQERRRDASGSRELRSESKRRRSGARAHGRTGGLCIALVCRRVSARARTLASSSILIVASSMSRCLLAFTL